MPNTVSHGVRIHYRVRGAGPEVVLVHGWTASGEINWEMPGWVDFLAKDHRVLTMDLRGHGKSGKPHDAAQYSIALMADDVLAAMAAARFQRATVLGYSMGAMVAMELLINHPEPFRAGIIGGMGAAFPTSMRNAEDLRREETAPIAPLSRSLRRTARGAVEFLRHYDALAQRAIRNAIFKGGRPVDTARLHEIRVPVLVVVGTRDGLGPGTNTLLERIPDSRRVLLPGRGHIQAVADPLFKEAVAAFLAEVEGGDATKSGFTGARTVR
ncbi:MAG: alpha/beta fold hydrolase [Chloroflexi bacterium]|nr:alpha/beta fold hydrolase [Chloroflexota bacterium]